MRSTKMSSTHNPTSILSAAVLLGVAVVLFALPALAQAPPPKPPQGALHTPMGIPNIILIDPHLEVMPDGNDYVAVAYVGWRADGTKFQDTQGKHSTFELDKSFPAWRDSVTQLKVGEKRRFWFPPNVDPQGKLAIFDIQLLGVRPIPNPPGILSEPPRGTEPLPTGAYTKMLEKGTGEELPGPSDVAVLQFTGWTADGKTFRSTVLTERMAMLPLDKIDPLIADCILQMRVGEKRLCWAPSHARPGDFWPEKPAGPLGFHLELMRILPSDVLQTTPTGEGTSLEREEH